jgi:putative Ca2+/H+ antiporter (TMEM165/GDT1 family)
MQVAEKEGKISAKTKLSALAEVASLIFVAEWGDRSMLATIGLAVHKSPFGVFAGASLGHAVATAIAVVAGSLASKYISEKKVNLVGGVLFLIFGVETALGLGIF